MAHAHIPSVYARTPITKLIIGRVIRDARLNKGLKQIAVAAQLGLRSSSFLTHIEQGRMIPSLDLSAKLERTLDLPHHTLTSLVLKHRLQELTAMLVNEAEERGLKVKVEARFL